ncbi:Nep1-domain-containing protein [Rhizophagus irregularis]|uniref:Nep1-domain-containing protein n=3 Tax=Rhizophagus irregularis TaxID=588596 RepID=A0A2I1EW71_9GLOM|nr:Alpha/beta knot methyltransferase [Rhizophagus irregularis DAOM 181602=DAOM 197198]EXX58638.1 Emg1p [Rhizophagus irregularis DAOM 197198w]PKC13792.1 Nep1-domain-containing protein [Rhizophagus irregularis]PKK66526.1 Nep1-domain-containing protein [Rhizophagus irregularis]PKY26370.1 Nep1-domain-containing protein [Rhizophagus irregularis]POG64229.1 Alpha/beta knot methyltransferase [Rhizophagus irregularis DAOM 181602=DAOM 197198]|eukprot:XP_025171095.1 Alpha/beta knot methyltransferase [Rhizophagus irregularis DAOM 181602=DAOM 197198]
MAKTKRKNKNKKNREESKPYSNNPQSNNNSSKVSSDLPKQITNSNNEKINISISTQTDDKKNISIATQTDDIISITKDTINNNDNNNYSNINTDIFLVPKAPKLPKTFKEKESTRRLIVVLDKACLETCKVTNSNRSSHYQLLNCDDQKSIKKLGSDPTTYRPDITHQCLMALLDSPLNKAGLMQIYIHTTKNVLIEVNPHVRIPRTFKRFSGLMVQLLHKLSIHSVDGNEKLLRVIKNPITNYLPTSCVKLALSYDAQPVRLSRYLPTIPPDQSICIAIGAMAHGTDNFADDWVDEKIGISQYPLSAAVACSKFCCELESFWGIW